MGSTKAANQQHLESMNVFGKPLTIFGVPVDRETIFANHKGAYKIRVEKRQRKLIVKTTFIKFFLHHSEQIRCLTTGYSPVGLLEQLLTGPAFLFFKRAIFVFTNKRILHIPTRFNGTSRAAISQILYADCNGIRVKGRSLIIDYKNGKKEVFSYIGRKEKKKIKHLITDPDLSAKDNARFLSRTYLCPSCANILRPDTSFCAACKLTFKSNLKAKLRSLLIPGGGYFYSRHPIWGAIIGSLEIVIIGFLIIKGLAINNGTGNGIGMLALLACILILEKLISAFHSKQLVQDYIPEDEDFAMRKI